MTARDSRTRYVVLAIWFGIALAFQITVSVRALAEILMHTTGAGPHVFAYVVVPKIVNPFACILLGFYVAAVRIDDLRAWLMLGLLWSFSINTDGLNWPDEAMRWHTWLKHPALVYRTFAARSWSVWMALFALYFPDRASFDVRWPRVKWFLLIPLGAVVLITTVLRTLRNEVLAWHPAISPVEGRLASLLFWPSITLFLLILGAKLWTTRDADDRRRLRVLTLGLALSFLPLLTVDTLSHMMKVKEEQMPPGLMIPASLFILFCPLTLAYVTVVERALDVSVIVRQGLRYAFARRGVLVIQIGISVTLVLLVAFLSARLTFAGRVVLTGAGVGLVLLTGRAAHRLGGWIDRRFFREAYDAERLLAELADTVGSVVELPHLLTTVATRIAAALHVSEIAVLLRESSNYRLAYALGYSETPAIEIEHGSAIVRALETRREATTVYLDDARSWANRISRRERVQLEELRTQLLLPLAHRQELLGFLSLGRRLSEEAYVPSDVSVLQSLANQTSLAIENSRLTLTIASETAEREVIQRELAIAREVQQRLLPQKAPVMPGLECFGACRPAQEVGGDYFDFVELPDGQLGIAIGDISGKGIPASLLMASLQACLRGQTLAGSMQLEDLMRNVNRLLYAASPINRYATFFYGRYESSNRLFTYVNAGHNAPMLLRGRELSRLETGGPPVGLLPQAVYESGTVELASGDLLVLFTDGITEANNAAEEEWGEHELAEALTRMHGRVAEEIVSELFQAADVFAAGAPQHDDMTAVVLRVAV